MKTIGIKLADGSFYPVLEDNTPSEKKLELTTAHNNQTKVMVDLYRSATCSMEDAEYVDSLQIENLVARPNGETDIKFTVSLDEDNQLSAKIVDSETGNESKTTITLVSRTLEERLVTDEYDINDSDSNEKKGSTAGATVAGAVAAGGLLAAAAALRNKSEAEVEPEEEVTTDDTTIEENEVPMGDEIALDEPPVEATDNTDNTDEPSDSLPDMDFDLPDDSENAEAESDEAVVDETTVTDDAASDELGDMSFDLPDDSENTVTETDETIVSDDAASDELGDMSFDLPDDSENTASETDETIVSDDAASEELGDMNFDLPDDSENTVTETDETISADETISDDDMFTTEDTTDISTTDNSDSLPDMDFDLPDDTSETEAPEMPDDFFNTDDLDNPDPTEDTPAASGLNFDGLYDEETERGTPAQNDEDEIKKKTKVPVIICIVCAIICIIATLLILFIIPSKYNLITKKHAKDVDTAVAIEQPAPEPEPIPEPEPEPAVPEAKEDEIVIIEKAEEVVPKQPPVAEEKPKNITYKIKWGDTLWDIADTYYKNPWKYKYIARYNGIKNPDYIISGTKIIIPAQ